MNEGHFNVCVRDHDSSVTGYGKHDRVMCCQPDGEGLYMRIDHKWALGTPTTAEMLTVARKHQGVRGRWKLERLEGWADGKHTDAHFVRA